MLLPLYVLRANLRSHSGELRSMRLRGQTHIWGSIDAVTGYVVHMHLALLLQVDILAEPAVQFCL